MINIFTFNADVREVPEVFNTDGSENTAVKAQIPENTVVWSALPREKP